MRHRTPDLIAALLLTVLCSSAIAGDVQKSCHVLPLLARYESAGMLQRAPDGTISLRLTADLHFADCGAPDCYGTNILVTMTPSHDKDGCSIREALVRTQDFVETGCAPSGSAGAPRREIYFPDSGGFDLSDRAQEKLTLRGKDGRHAIVILRENFFYFDDATPGGTLRTELPGDDAEETCCWGATSSAGRFETDD